MIEPQSAGAAVPEAAPHAQEDLAAENARLRAAGARANRYIREKVNELLRVLGTAPLRPEELNDETLVEIDPIGIASGAFRQILGHLNATNERLKFANDEIQAIFDSVGLGVLVIDRQMRILACNSPLREQFFPGRNGEIGSRCRELVCGVEEPERPCPFLDIFASGATLHRREWPIRGRRYDVVGTPVRNQRGEVTSIVMVYADVTERIRAEEALRGSEERYRDLFENAHDLIMSIRLDGSIEFVNQAWCTTLEYTREEAAALTIFELLHPECEEECRGRITTMLGDCTSAHLHTFLRTKSGRKVVVEGDLSFVVEQGRPVGMRGILRDNTEKEQLEEEIRKREKLESIGLLAGGIAHDFNNILTAILGNINLAALRARPGEEISARLEEAEKAALSARDLTQQLLTFARGGLPVRRIAPLGDLIRDQTAFALRGSAVSCSYEIPPDLCAAEIDEGQIGQVVHNLVRNAVQATPGGGRVRVSAHNAEVSAREGLPVPPGTYVVISVADSGCGIPAENLPRIFDPYFTTKREGNGLGLAIVHSIVEKHDGCVRVTTAVDWGSTFSIYLPSAGRAPAAAAATGGAPRGKGRVLVMDDETIVREVAVHMLEELGYDVACAVDGDEAIRLYREARDSGRRFHAVIMDLTVPGGMGGNEAIRELLELDPGVRAIVSSGYSNDPVMARCRDYGFCGVIAKPYKLSDLAKVVSGAIRDGAHRPALDRTGAQTVD